MPLLMALLGGILTICGSMVGRVLLALGMSYVTYSGFDVGINWLLTSIKTNMSAMPADILSFMAWIWLYKAIGLIFSAYSSALLIKMAGSTKFTKLITKSA